MQKLQKALKRVLAVTLCAGCVLTNGVLSFAEGEQVLTNLAKGKTVTANAEYASGMQASKAVDGDETTRWSTEQAAPAWLQVDLGAEKEIHEFRILSEDGTNQYQGKQLVGEFKIEGSNDGQSWTVIHESEDKSASGFAQDTVVKLSSPVTYRHVKLTVEKLFAEAYPYSVSLKEFEVRGIGGSEPQEPETPQDPSVNVAQGKSAVASSIEAESVKAQNAVDGDTTSRNSRWGSKVGAAPHWIYVDLGREMDVKTVRVFWETRKATNYKIQLASTLSNPMQESDWTDAKAFTQRPTALNETITLGEQPKKARYVRLLVNNFDAKDPDSDGSWNSISIYELEVYGGEPPVDVKEQISVTPPKKGDKTLEVNIPELEQYDITYNGTDYEQVVDTDRTIYEPVVDTTVNVSFKIVNKATQAYEFKEIPVVIPGTYTKADGDNAAPDVLPEIREWKGQSGVFTPTAGSRIVIKDSKLQEMADAFAADYQEITGNAIEVVKADTAKDGDYFFALTTDTKKGLKEEGYLMTVDSKVSVEAETATGAFWATRTILQSLKGSGNLPQGIARDYPLYKVRGFILDVGRKTFTMDYLRDTVKQMSWYKMNDFQVHLNDNLIPLEHYKDNEELMNAYSAFRLESDIKEGGNGGLNKADLTSKDVFYTKDEFRDFIKESRVYGVEIVPEIDTPAHSLALTKVRPDLRHGINGRENDHLNLSTRYDDSLEFVQSIFDEYMGKDLADPVFDEKTTVHVGADEYTANKEAYRRFADDMLKYVQESGRTARIWGSLSTLNGTTAVRSKDVQMNLWNFGWANMDKMYEQGYDLINCNDGNYYIVPNAGYYYDYLNAGTLYNLAINSIGGITIPAGDKQMIGGAIAVWNDMTDYLENGVSEYDVYDRINDEIALFGAKLWGKGSKSLADAQQDYQEFGDAPGTDFGYKSQAQENGAVAHYPMDDRQDVSGNNADLKDGKNAAIQSVDGKNVLELNGKESYMTTGLNTVGLGNDLRVKVKRTSASKEEQVLFESSYGSIKAVQKETGKVGFTRENHDYSFNYELPLNEWVELEFKNEQNKTYLYVNGELKDILGDDEKAAEGKRLLATTMFPVERIGSKTNAFEGYVDDLRIGRNKEFTSTMPLDYAVWTAKAVLEQGKNEELAALVKEAEELMNSYEPTAEEVQRLTAAIEEKLEAAEFKKADYSRVDSYLGLIPEDTSVFTAESVAWLEGIVAQIRRDLPAEMQSTVDGYEKQLAEALAGLTPRKEGNVHYVDNKTLKATASSHQDDASAPGKAIDGDKNTIWHSKWSITTLPHWIDLEMSEKTAVNGLTYVPRQTGTNGNVTKYRIEVSDDGETYRTIKEGTLPNNSETKVIEFDRVETKHVRLVYVEAANNNGAAAELSIHKADVPADIDGLNSVIGEAKGIENQGFTEESWDALQAKIKEAEALANSENPDANDVEIMKRELSKSMTALELKEKTPEPEKPNKTELQKVVKEYGNLKKGDYTEATWKKFEEALEKANAVLADNNATQNEIDDALANLKEARKQLKEIGSADPGPQEPSKDTSKDSSKNDSVRTGDQTPLLALVVVMFAAVGVVFVMLRKKAGKR